MTICEDFSDVSDPEVASLLETWLRLVAERYCMPGVAVHVYSGSLTAVLPVGLVLVLTHDELGWVVQVQSHLQVAALGIAGRPFSRVGSVRPRMDAGLADPVVGAQQLMALTDPEALLRSLEPGPDPRLLNFWLVRCGLSPRQVGREEPQA